MSIATALAFMVSVGFLVSAYWQGRMRRLCDAAEQALQGFVDHAEAMEKENFATLAREVTDRERAIIDDMLWYSARRRECARDRARFFIYLGNDGRRVVLPSGGATRAGDRR